MIKGLIFDYGGTIDSDGVHWSEILWESYLQYSIPVSKSQFRNVYVLAERELAKHPYIRPEYNFYDLLKIKIDLELGYLIEQGVLDLVYKKYATEMARFCYDKARKTVNKACKILDSLNECYQMVLVSNFYGNIQTVLTDFGLNKYFSHVVESAIVGVRKPDPRIFQLGVEALGLKPQETVVIGDSYKKDIVPASSLGCQTIWLKGKGWTDEEDVIKHEHIIYSFGDLKNILLKVV